MRLHIFLICGALLLYSSYISLQYMDFYRQQEEWGKYFLLWISHDGDVKPAFWNVSILQINQFKIPHSFNCFLRPDCHSSSQSSSQRLVFVISGHFYSLETCIHQEAWTQKIEQAFPALTACQWKQQDLLLFSIACFLKDAARKPLVSRAGRGRTLVRNTDYT